MPLLGERLGDAVDEGEGGDTDDDRIGPHPADQQSLQAGQQRAEQQSDDQTQAEAQPVRCQNEHHRGHAHGGAERKRHDVAADRDERHADRHAADKRHRGEKREDAWPGQEAWRGEDDGKKDDYADGLSPGEHTRPVEAHPPQISCGDSGIGTAWQTLGHAIVCVGWVMSARIEDIAIPSPS